MDVIGSKAKSIEKNKRYQIIKEYPKNFFFFEFNSCLIKSFTNFDSVRGLINPEYCCEKNHFLSLNL
jgi:phosphate starvation-inducible membrane PsiE